MMKLSFTKVSLGPLDSLFGGVSCRGGTLIGGGGGGGGGRKAGDCERGE